VQKLEITAISLMKELRQCQNFSKRISDAMLLKVIEKVLLSKLTGNRCRDLQIITAIQDSSVESWFKYNLKKLYTISCYYGNYETNVAARTKQYDGEMTAKTKILWDKFILERKRNAGGLERK